ncbi:cilia- and flagella-associated protein 47 [Eptesicus fuscus]|uniref:cilia- and flagella-associated protein 47 n=1 Tax=Eptesicus fuscus TaxID=29078 RepID=UPI002403FD69|nr:cilia- and flagella-associated protein 47 [Eptesicus fuscus]
MYTPRGSLIPREVETPKELQLRVTPVELKFQDTMAGKVYRQSITVRNLGRSNQKIRFLEPVKPQFKLVFPSVDKEIASGLQMTAMVEYHPNKNEDISDQLLIAVGNKAVEVPLIGLIPACKLEIKPDVDFGTLVANSKVYSKEVKIINRGKAPGKFTTLYQGQLPIVIFPTNGIVEPKSSKIIKVEFCADQPSLVNEVAKVSLQGRPDIFLNIRVRVVEQILELLNLTGNQKVECIHFGSAFFGTSKIEHALLYNNSPEIINWVAIIQNDSVGEELGTNIQQRTDVAINNLAFIRQIKNMDITTFISCVPNEGRLSPYQKTKITFCFSPKIITEGKKDYDPSHRQDYAVFLRFDTVGSKDGFLRDDNSKTIKNEQLQKLELALTGSGLPVLMQFNSGSFLTFPTCSFGECSKISFIMENRSKSLPVMYHFRKTANFRVRPERGSVDEGCMQKVTCSFMPHQIGVFTVKQFIDFIGPVADKNFQSLLLRPFYHIHLVFKGACKISNKKVVFQINPGISPIATNPTGQFVVKDLTTYKECAPVAMLQSALTTIHNHQSSKGSVQDALIAFPNDRTASIRPGDQEKHFRTIFTKVPRHNYVDTEFTYTDSEVLEKKAHEDYYKNYIDSLRNARLKKKAEVEDVYAYDDLDIGLCPASGMKSPALLQSDLEVVVPPLIQCEVKPYQPLCTRNMESKEAKALGRKVLKALKSHPTTLSEKRDCKLILTPKQIHQVIVGPSVLNFGDICVNSINTHRLHVVNMLPKYILIHLDANLKELQKTKQFSYVIPPSSSTHISITFQSPTAGKFWKSFTFRVNNIPGGHLLVRAIVMPVRLELSSDEVVLKPHGFLLKTCFRETVTLHNRQNYRVHFEWIPVCTEEGVSFSIRPSKGIVEPFSSLECEVTWLPGFSAPDRGEFTLQVDEGNTMTLKCVAHRGNTKVLFLEPRILFNNSPQGLTTWKKVILHNVGQNHAYFKVCSKSLMSIINIVPSEGIIPFGGLTVVTITCTPTMAEKFDTIAKVAIRHATDIELRIGGTAEVASIEIKPDTFIFGGTFLGGTQIIPFFVKNKGITRARVEFNLEGHLYFSVVFKHKTGKHKDPAFPDRYYLELEAKTSMECGIAFAPKEVTTYEFDFDIHINFFESSKIYTQCHLSKSPVPRVPLIRPCHVQATVLQAPVKLSRTQFIFDIPPYAVRYKKRVSKTQHIILHNFSKRKVEWCFDITNAEKLFKDGIFEFNLLNGILLPNEEYKVYLRFCPTHAVKYTAYVPVRLNKSPVCYQMLHLIGELKLPKLSFDRAFMFFTPVPLDVASVMDVNILPQSYYRESSIKVVIPPASLLGIDEEIHPLTVSYPKGTVIEASLDGINTELICRFSFKSSKPLTIVTTVLFCDDRNCRFSLPVIATAENCILTTYPYLAFHIDEENITVRNEKDPSPVKTKKHVSLPSEKDGLSSPAPSKCEDAESANRFFIGIEATPGKVNLAKSEKPKKKGDKSMGKEEENKKFCPDPGTKAYDFIQKVVNAAETWFSLFGWPEGPHSLSVPESIRRDVSKMQAFGSISLDQKHAKANNFLRYTKTIYDVIRHLSGKMPNGVNSSQSLPVDYIEKLIQLHLQHSSLLDFLRDRGAYVSYIQPEYLFEPEDYKKWVEMREKRYVIINMTEFEAWSQRAWTDVLLQIYKVLILSHIVPHSIDDLPPINMRKSPKVNPCFVESNVYSDSERILLSWLNTNYENARHIVWKNCKKGIPSERWVLNFDKHLSDGLVFATVLGAYCPFLIEPYFKNMYTQPKGSEQCFHNCAVVVDSLREIGFNIGIQASDICDYNPILMLMLCVYMYERLPTYLPKMLVTFQCTLHDTVKRKVLVKNSSSKKLVYNATIIGRDAADFTISTTDNIVTVPPKDEIQITVKFNSRFLHPAKASLILISTPNMAVGGTTMIFALKGEVRKFNPMKIIRCKSPCYTWKEITVNVKNPFHTAGDFNAILVESSTFICFTSQLNASGHSYTNDSGNSSEQDTAPKTLKTSIRSSFIREFFCPSPTVHLGAGPKGTSSLELSFVPFDMQIRYCVIILSNKMIGELVYVVEGKGMAPLPSRLPAMTSLNLYDYTCSPEGRLDEDNPVLYLKCKPCHTLDVDLILPLTNEAKEKALAFAARQQMSDVEYQRRLITGTLESSSIRVAIAILGLTRVETCMLFNISKLKQPKFVLYATEVSLPGYFYVPKEIHIPQYPERQAKGLKPVIKKVPEGSFPVALKFAPLCPGRYPCKILLTSRYDVRVYYIEGVVSDECPETRFDFETPAFEALTQNIPIMNRTMNDWRCHVIIEGECFYGPPDFSVKSGETAQYPLTFKPHLECEVMGKLTVQNKIDGMEHVFAMKGIGRRPVALECIIAHCQVGIPEDRIIMVPNHTKNIVTFKVSSNVPIVWGQQSITIEPGSVIPYVLHISSWKRGVFKGKLSFSIKKSCQDDDCERDSDEDQYQHDIQDQDGVSFFQKLSEKSIKLDKAGLDDDGGTVQVWYNLEIHIYPGEPVNIIEMKCVAMETTCFEIPLRNAKETTLQIEVLLSDPTLSGIKKFVLNPEECIDYTVCYTPAATGCKEESIIFQPDKVLEFWYVLKFTVEFPDPIKLPEMQCDLGKFIIQNFPLVNPTHETLELQVRNSNPDNFLLDSHKLPLIILPRSTERIRVRFCPSSLGRASHQATLTFYCAQFEEWKFLLSGIGLFPQPLEIERITTYLQQLASLAITFKNPTDEHVLIDVILTNREMPKNLTLGIQCDSFLIETTAFKLSLDYSHGIELPPRGIIPIPVCFVPKVMKLKKTMAVVQMRKANGKNWPIDNFDELSPDMKRMMGIHRGEIQTIRWIYPILGLPQAKHDEFPPAVIKCQSRKRIEKELQVTITGDFIGDHPILNVSDFVVIPKKRSYASYEDIDGIPIKREFEYEIIYESEEVRTELQPSVAIFLMKKSYNIKTQVITLDFNLIFSPKKPMKSQIILKIECITDGIWNFPVTLIATEPEVDDVINIEGKGLFKEAVTEFWLSGRKRYSDDFVAYFLPDSDPEFFVKPESGEIPPFDSDGITLIVGFKPHMYGRKYKARLVIQTADMYYLYAVNGLPQSTKSPKNVKAKIDATNKKFDDRPVTQHRFIQENNNMVRTGVSSTIKGASWMLNDK